MLIGIIALISLVIVFFLYCKASKSSKSVGTMEGTDSLSEYSNSEKEDNDGYRILIERESHSKMHSMTSGSDLQKVTSSSLKHDSELFRDVSRLNFDNKRSEII